MWLGPNPVRLLEVIACIGYQLYGVGVALGQLEVFVLQLGEKPIPENTCWLLSSLLKLHREHFKSLGLSMSVKSMDRLIAVIDGPDLSTGKVGPLATDLLGRLQDELSDMLLWQIPRERVGLFSANTFGEKVAASFPSAAVDIAEAGRCLALDRFPACIFHLMRVAERVLRVVATELSVPLASLKKGRSWGGVIHDIKEKLDAMPDDAPKKLKLREPLHFLSEVKDLWRDKGIHPVEDFSPERTERVYNAIRSFIQTCAENDIREPDEDLA